MRLHMIGAGILTLAVMSGAHAAQTNSAHICGDERLSAQDQNACRAQMEAATTDAQRTKAQHTFEARAAATTQEGGSSVAAAAHSPAPSLTGIAAGPATAPAGTTPDAYPAAKPGAPDYAGRDPQPQTGKPPT